CRPSAPRRHPRRCRSRWRSCPRRRRFPPRQRHRVHVTIGCYVREREGCGGGRDELSSASTLAGRSGRERLGRQQWGGVESPTTACLPVVGVDWWRSERHEVEAAATSGAAGGSASTGMSRSRGAASAVVDAVL
ncbi:hypothetical protein ACHAWF_000934, partial [Thalassiosira exigua]